jgi:hypothetical protein
MSLRTATWTRKPIAALGHEPYIRCGPGGLVVTREEWGGREDPLEEMVGHGGLFRRRGNQARLSHADIARAARGAKVLGRVRIARDVVDLGRWRTAQDAPAAIALEDLGTQRRRDPPQTLVIATSEDLGDPHLERLLDGRISLDPAIDNDRAPVVDELERLMADVRAVELGAVGEDDGSPAFDTVDDDRGGQVVESFGELRVGGVHLPSLARERDSSIAVSATDTMRGSCTSRAVPEAPGAS